MSVLTEFKDRFSNTLLKQLTRDDTTSTTPDDDKIAKAIEDMAGEFHKVTGMDFDEAKPAHLSTGIVGVMYFLQLYKHGETAFEGMWNSRFYAGLLGLRKQRNFLPLSDSRFTASRPVQGTLPDMDKTRLPFTGGRRGQRGDRSNGF